MAKVAAVMAPVWRAAAVAADIPALPPVDAAASRLRELAGIRSSHPTQ
jgi:hypothetical protein